MALNASLKENLKSSSSAIFADLIETLSNQDGFLVFIGEDKREGLTTWDSTHLTPLASEYVAETLLIPLITAGNTRSHPPRRAQSTIETPNGREK